MPRIILFAILVFILGFTPLLAQGVYFQKGEGGFDVSAAIHGLKGGHGFGAGLHYTFWGLGNIGFEISDSRFLTSEENNHLDRMIRICPQMAIILVRDREGLVPLGVVGSLGVLLGGNEYIYYDVAPAVIGRDDGAHGALILGLTFYRNFGNSGHPEWQPSVHLKSRTYAGDAAPENSVRFTAGITNYIPVASSSLALGITPSYMRDRDNWAVSLTLGLFLKTAYADPGQKSRHPRNKPVDRW